MCAGASVEHKNKHNICNVHLKEKMFNFEATEAATNNYFPSQLNC